MSDDIAVYCRNGHFIGFMPEASYRGYGPGRLRQIAEEQYFQEVERQNFCTECGESSLIACPSCETVILYERQGRRQRPAYCGVCGKPFPWTEQSLATASEYTDELEALSDSEKATLKATFPDLSRETPKTELAASRFSKLLHKVGPAAGDALLKIVVNFTTEKVTGLINNWRW
jgi:hypothetical protein